MFGWLKFRYGLQQHTARAAAAHNRETWWLGWLVQRQLQPSRLWSAEQAVGWQACQSGGLSVARRLATAPRGHFNHSNLPFMAPLSKSQSNPAPRPPISVTRKSPGWPVWTCIFTRMPKQKNATFRRVKPPYWRVWTLKFEPTFPQGGLSKNVAFKCVKNRSGVKREKWKGSVEWESNVMLMPNAP